MHQWQSLNLTSWTLLVSLEVRQCKLCYCTRVKLRFLPVYIESLTMSSQEPLLGKQVPKQVLYFVKVNTNGKLETRTKGIVDKCSDLTCTKKYALTEGAKGWGGVNVGQSLSPPPPVILCLLRAWNTSLVKELGVNKNKSKWWAYWGSQLLHLPGQHCG